MICQTPQWMNGADFWDTVGSLARAGDGAEFGEERVDDPEIVAVGQAEDVESQSFQEVQRSLDVLRE